MLVLLIEKVEIQISKQILHSFSNKENGEYKKKPASKEFEIILPKVIVRNINFKVTDF